MGLPALYELTSQLRELAAMVGTEDDSITAEAIETTLNSISMDFRDKSIGISRLVANQDAMATAIENAAAAMKVRADRLRRRNEHMRAYLLTNMQAAGITKLDSPELVVSIKKNPARVIVTDEALVPAEFMVTPPPAPPPEPRPDKKAIGDAIKAGQTVPGCHTEQGFRLEIKP